MQNPLFESLIRKVQTYENPQMTEQATPPKGTVFSDFVKSLAQIGTKLVDQYIAAIKSYPDTKIKKEYEKSLPDKLAAILASVDKTKTVGIQVDSLFKAVKTEATSFFKLGEGDTEVVKFLKPWRESFRAGFNAYQQAVNSAMEYVKQQETAGSAKMSDAEFEMISKAVAASIEGYKKSTQIESTLKDDWGSNEGYSYKEVSTSMNESTPAIEQLISNKICVDFNTYNKIINEAKEDRVARRAAKGARIEGENLGAQIDGVLSVIGSRLSDPNKAKFKSLAMKDQFMSIATNLSQIQTELSVDDSELKNVNFDEINKQISNLKTLFADKKKSFESTYAEEEKNTRSFKTLEVATPEVTKYLTDGDVQFGQLSILAQKAANLAAEEAKKPKAGSAETVAAEKPAEGAGNIGSKVESAPVKKSEVPKGKKNDEVKKFQEGVVAKYSKDKRISATQAYKDLKKSLDSGQGGYFGPKTDAVVKMLKAGFKLSDTGSDITKELLDKINAQPIKESKIFEQDFDYDAAEKASGGGGGSSSPRKVTKEDISKSKAALKDAAEEITKDKPKLPQEEVKKQIDDAISKAKEEWNKESAIKELKTLGAIPNPNYGKDGQLAVATVNGMRFYANGVALRQFDSMMGTYNVAKDEFIGDDGSKDKITTLAKSGIPFKFSNAFSQFQYDPAKACKDYKGWSAGTVSILNKAFKITYNKSLDKHLANKLSTWYGSVNDDVDAFRKKFASVLS
jgi:hypothetical protein